MAKPLQGRSTQGQDYRALWQHYRQGIKARHGRALDYAVGRRAFRDGLTRKVISLMLASESMVVKQLHQRYGKPQAIAYVNQMARRICSQQGTSVSRAQRRKSEVSIGE